MVSNIMKKINRWYEKQLFGPVCQFIENILGTAVLLVAVVLLLLLILGVTDKIVGLDIF